MAVAGTIFCIWLFRANYRHNHFFWRSFSIMMAMAFPFALSGILFIISHYLKKKEQVEYEQSLQEKQGENQSV
jgi:pilus assembly protein TadC